MSANFYAHGQWNCECQRCGFKVKSSSIRKEWSGLMVCTERCWEPRNQQDLIRAVTDKQTVPFALPESEDRFESGITANDL